MSVLAPENIPNIVINSGNQYDTAEVIKQVIYEDYKSHFVSDFINTHNITPDLNGIKKAAKIIFDNTTFVKDNPKVQVIRTLQATLRGGGANCVDYSTAIGTIATALNLPNTLVMAATSYDNPTHLSHIYIKVNGTPIDLVLGQSNGQKIFTFGKEFHTLPRKEYIPINKNVMRIETLNGLSRVNLDGLSRVNLNGLSRVNLNGYDDDDFDLNDYLDECDYHGISGSMQGFEDYMLQGKAERQARRARRKAKREARRARKEQRQVNRGRRNEARTLRKEQRGSLKDRRMKLREERAANKSGFGTRIGQLAEKYAGGKMQEMFQEPEYIDMPPLSEEPIIAQDKGLLSPPKLFKDPAKWFSSKKVPMWQKAAVIGGGVVVIDAVTGGNIILQRTGIMKTKRKR